MATTTVAVAELLLGFGSVVVEERFAVTAMGVPEAVPAFTFNTTVKVVDAPAMTVGFEQVSVPPSNAASPTGRRRRRGRNKSRVGGMASLNATVVAVAAPLFLTTTV